MVATRRGRGKFRTIRSAEEGESGGRKSRPEALEEIGGTSFAFFEPADTSTQGGTRRFHSQAVGQLLSKREDVSSSLHIRNVASGATVSRGELAFNPTAIRLTTAGGNEREILCV
jgi:hypothetical protein